MKIELQPALEIQKAHDRLCAVVTGEVECGVSAADREMLHYALDALCWVLRHDHNPTFQDNLDQLLAAMRAHGIEERMIE